MSDAVGPSDTIQIDDALTVARGWIDTGKPFHAEVICRKLLDARGNDFRAWSLLGEALERTDRADEALGCYETAIRINPGHAHAFTRRAMVLLRRHWGAPPPARPNQDGPRVMCSTLGSNGRFGNQLLQYAVTRLYADLNGITAEFPDWLGRDLFDLDDPMLGPLMPVASEDDIDILGAVSGRVPAALAEHDIWGYFQKGTADLAPFRDRVRDFFRPGLRARSHTRQWEERLRRHGRTVVALHLRRGDFDGTIFWIAPEAWYLAWLEALWPQLDAPVLYVATDDDAVLNAFAAYRPLSAKNIGGHLPGAEFFCDFAMLTRADHLAISNSSFSFVAAMLNKHAASFKRPVAQNQTLVDFDPWHAAAILKGSEKVDSGTRG